MEMRRAVASLDPSETGGSRIQELIFEQLVRFDQNGRPQPSLAVSWQHDAEGRRWEFRLRPGVKFHDGYPLTPAAVGGLLQKLLGRGEVGISGDTVVVQAERPRPGLLADLARPAASMVARGPDGALVGTGPFRVSRWEPGKHVGLAAHEEYWGGRPFLDAVEIDLGHAAREQLPDLELGRADLVEIQPDEARRASERGHRVWSSVPIELLALDCGDRDPRLREALALSIDRAAIYSVLLHKQGEISAALLPEWLSGYAFLFSTSVDLARARTLAASLPARGRPAALTYDAPDPLARIIAERIAVNARDAGITLQVSPQARGELRLVRLRLPSLDPARALADLAAALGLGEPGSAGTSPEALYAGERRLLEGYRVIPILYLPETWASAGRVKVWLRPLLSRTGFLDLADTWLDKP